MRVDMTTRGLSIGPYRFSDTDMVRTLANLGPWWDHLTSGIDATSATHYGSGIADVLAPLTGEPRTGPLPELLERLGRAVAEQYEGNEGSPDVARAVQAVWDGLHRSMQSLRSAGAVATRGDAVVHQINTSRGGVPKRPVERVEVDFDGIVGDRQGNRRFHGRPWQALCFWSHEVIEGFAAAGNPIFPGAAGENVTIGGIDWQKFRPGVRARVGTVLVDMTSWAIPCKHNAQWFANRDFRQMSHERGPVSRLYATVVEPGTIATGDTVTLLP